MRRYLLYLFMFCACTQPHSSIKPLEFNDMGYGKLNLFVYEVARKDSNNQILGIDTLGLFCSDIVMPQFDSQSHSEWAFLKLRSGRYTLDETKQICKEGIKSNDSTLFIHPPRAEHFSVLEFCPMPLFNNMWKKWNWDLAIGAVWRINDLYPINDVDTFHIDYMLKDTSTVEAFHERNACFHFIATSVSKYGISTGSYYLCNKYGLVAFSLKPINKTSYNFRLISTTNNIDSMSSNEQFIARYNKHLSKNRVFGIHNAADEKMDSIIASSDTL